jgi:hypothetical protein
MMGNKVINFVVVLMVIIDQLFAITVPVIVLSRI